MVCGSNQCSLNLQLCKEGFGVIALVLIHAPLELVGSAHSCFKPERQRQNPETIRKDWVQGLCFGLPAQGLLLPKVCSCLRSVLFSHGFLSGSSFQVLSHSLGPGRIGPAGHAECLPKPRWQSALGPNGSMIPKLQAQNQHPATQTACLMERHPSSRAPAPSLAIPEPTGERPKPLNRQSHPEVDGRGSYLDLQGTHDIGPRSHGVHRP